MKLNWKLNWKPNRVTLLLCSVLLCVFSSLLYAKESDIQFKLSAHEPKQGDTLRLDVWAPQPVSSATVRFNNTDYRLFKMSASPTMNHYMTYLGIPRAFPLGPQDIQCAITLKPGETHTKTLSISVQDGEFPKSIVTLSPEKQTLANNTEQLIKEGALITQIMALITEDRYFSGPFILPAEGRISSLFGAYRVYNDNRQSGRHSGVDIANQTGTPILAANSGKVVLSQPLQTHGHTVILDHGLGVFSIYNHLDQLLVKEGQIVEKGGAIGLMGSTGIATGPHVHWGVSVQNIRVNPLYWVKNEFLYE